MCRRYACLSMVVRPARRAALGSMLNWPILASSVACVGVVTVSEHPGVADPPAKPVSRAGCCELLEPGWVIVTLASVCMIVR